MIESQSKKGRTTKDKPVCDLGYLLDMMGGKKHLVKGIVDDFMIQIPKELQSLTYAVERAEFGIIKRYAHSMKSTLSIMGINSAIPILREMEDLGTKSANLEKIKSLNTELNELCETAVTEIKGDKSKYE